MQKPFIRRMCYTAVVLASVLARPSAAFAQDWPQWRGPNRDGIATHFQLPEIWPKEIDVVWQKPLGDGYSAPVIVAGRLYTHDREGEEEYVKCLDANTGELIWKRGYKAPYQMHPAATGHGLGPKATTTVAGGRVYAFGITSILSCLDAATGDMIWSHDLKTAYDAQPAEYGTAGSPLVDRSLVIVPVGGKRGGSVMAFDIQDGSLAWQAMPGEMPSFSSPIAADLGGIRHIVTFTEKHFVGINAKNGDVLWKYPFTTSYRQNTVTPVVVGDMVIASGLQKFAFALKVQPDGDSVKFTEAWKNRDLRIYMSSPVVVGDHVYGLGGEGALVCVNIRTGKTVWSGGAFGDYCSIVAAGDRLLILDTAGKLTVVKADATGYQEVGQSQVIDGKTWSHLALVGSRIYVRNRERLMCLDLSGKAAD